MIKKLTAVILSLLLVMSLAACASQNEKESTGASASEISDLEFNSAQFPYTFKDSNGKSVTLKEKPKKVAVLFSSYADIWKTSSGKVDITVGESVERGFAEKDAVLLDDGAGHGEINLEILTNAEPDLVIGTADYAGQADAVDFCAEKGIPSASFKVESFDDYLKVLKIFCEINGSEENYKTYGTEVLKRIEKIKQTVADYKESGKDAQSKILFIRAGSSAKSTKAKTSDDNFACAMLKELGAENIADSAPVLTGELSLETIIEEKPQRIFITTMGDENAAKDYVKSLFETDGWSELSCIKGGNYTFLEKELFHFKPNANWGKAYEVLAKALYTDIEIEK